MVTKHTAEEWKLSDTVIILGNFDGIHKGHQLLIEKALAYAGQHNLKTAVLTFLPHPSKLFGVKGFRLIYTEAEKELLFEKAGLDYYIIFPFNEESRSMSPEDFMESILRDKLGIRAVVVGSDYRFGKKAAGDVNLLRSTLEPLGIGVIVLDKLQNAEQDISSTRLRNVINEGELNRFEELTGRRFHIMGEVVHGEKLGRQIGFPTANLIPDEDKLLPPNGVYYVKVTWNNQVLYGLSNVGISPSLEGRPYSVETYIFDFEEEIYGQIIEVEFLEFMRPEMHFDSIEKLRLQIEQDVLAIKNKR